MGERVALGLWELRKAGPREARGDQFCSPVISVPEK